MRTASKVPFELSDALQDAVWIRLQRNSWETKSGHKGKVSAHRPGTNTEDLGIYTCMQALDARRLRSRVVPTAELAKRW